MLKQKANFNFDAGVLLTDRNIYSPTIHCYYYCCLQLVKYTINHFEGIDYSVIENNIREAKQTQKIDSHTYLINHITKSIESYNRQTSTIFRRKITDLKTLRVKSDYSIEQIGPSDCTKAKEIASYVKVTLHEIFHT